MKEARLSEEQIIGLLRDQEAGVTTVEGCRRHGLRAGTFWKRKTKYDGLDVFEAERLKW
jgi:putative transposase